MKLDKIEDLTKLFELCQKKGIESMKISNDSVEFKLRDDWAPKKRIRSSKIKEELNDPYTAEQALFWSAQPHVEG